MVTSIPQPPRLPSPPPKFLAAMALGLRRFFLALADLVVPPQLAISERVFGLGQTMGLHAVARLRIADRLAAGPRTSAELAAETGSDPDALHRLLRGLATAGVFALLPDGRFANNRLSRALATGGAGSMRDFAEYFGSGSNVAAWADLDRTLAEGGHAFERVHGMPIWDWFDRHPEERATFAAAMGSLTELYAPAVAAASPLAEGARVCDVGGGRGTLLAEVLLRHPGATGLLLEGPGVLEAARPYLAAKGVLDRVELVPGSFFAAVPAGCDAYLLKNVLHDWDDDRSLRILGACRAAMAPGARLLVVETVVEARTTRGMGPGSDLHMMIATSGGRERGREDFRRLFERTGFRLDRIVATASPMSVVFGVAVDV